jgi:hypothetical protein
MRAAPEILLGAAVAAAALVWDPRAPAADPKRALGLLLAVVLLAAAVVRPPGKRVALRVAPAALLFLGFVAWSALSLVHGVPSGARDLATWAAAAGLVVVTARWPARRAQAAAGWAAILAGSGASAVAVVERARGARGLFVHGGQGNANWLGLLLGLTIPLTLGLASRWTQRSRRAALAAALLLQAAGLVLSHSRVAWAACALASLPLLVAMASTSITARRRGVAVAAVALALAAALPAAARAAPVASAEPAPAADVPIPVAWQGRVWIWRTSADAAIEALPAGAGLGGFAHAYLDAQGKRLAPLAPRAASHRFVNATTAHCDWLEVLVDSGPVGLLLLALAVGSGLLASARAGWFAGADPPEAGGASARTAARWGVAPESCAAALASFAVCAMGDSPLRQPGPALLLGLAIGACPKTLALPRPNVALLSSAARVALTAASALLLAGSVRGWIADRRLHAARDAAPGEQAALLSSAARLDPGSGEIALERGLRELDLGRPEAALVELRRSRPLLANVGTDVAIGNAEQLLGDPEAARRAYLAALARHPGSFRAHANISQPLIALGRLDEAERHLAVAAELWPGHPRLLEMSDQLRRARLDREAGPP